MQNNIISFYNLINLVCNHNLHTNYTIKINTDCVYSTVKARLGYDELEYFDNCFYLFVSYNIYVVF